MNLTRKLAGLCLFVFLFISSIYADPIPNEAAEHLSDEELEHLTDEEIELLFYAESDLIFFAESGPVRSFFEIFPSLTPLQKARSRSSVGLRYSFEKQESPQIIPAEDSEIDLLSLVMEKKPSHIIEALIVVPYRERGLDRLDAYNALNRISNIKNQSIPLRGENIHFFTDTTRLESDRRMRPIPDPPLALMLPISETVYVRIKDAYFGTLYVRGDISTSPYGISYNMTNFKTVRYYLLPIMRAETFSCIIYLEPVKEGVLIYSMSGIYIPGFVADKVNLTPNMNARIMTFINWITEGLRIQESESWE